MSLATFKKKTINSSPSAVKISGKPSNKYWLYQGPYGVKGNLPSTIFNQGLVGPNGMVVGDYYNASNSGFSLTGANRNIGAVGKNMIFSKSATPFRGAYPKGWGGKNGRYPDGPYNISLNIMPVKTKVAVQDAIVKPPVLSNTGMIARKYRWIHSGTYPNNWVQPNYTGNQTDTASQGLHIHNKSGANYCIYDVNDTNKYVNYFKKCGSTGCRTTPADGYTMSIQQATAPYTKTLHQPNDSSQYTLRIQNLCQNQVGLQKPFPYPVQTGTGVLTGGISVNSVANACNTSNTVSTPPDWYTGASKLNSDGTRPTIKDQIDSLKPPVNNDVLKEVFIDVFLEGTTEVR